MEAFRAREELGRRCEHGRAVVALRHASALGVALAKLVDHLFREAIDEGCLLVERERRLEAEAADRSIFARHRERLGREAAALVEDQEP